MQQLHPFHVAVLHFIEVGFHFRGELDVDNIGEPLLHQLRNHFSQLGGHQAFRLALHILPAGERGDGRRVGGRSADAVLLENLDQRRLGIARGRLCEVLVLFQLLALDGQVHLQRRQLRGFFLRFILALNVKRGEAGEIHIVTRRLEDIAVCLDFRLRCLLHAVRHLRGGKAAPDQLVELILIGRQAAFDAVGRQSRHRGTDGLVTVLRVASRFEHTRLWREVFVAVGFLHIPGDLLNGNVRHAQRVGTHIGDQTGRAHAFDFHALIQLLRHAHGAP